jgi:hypothetical protein
MTRYGNDRSVDRLQELYELPKRTEKGGHFTSVKELSTFLCVSFISFYLVLSLFMGQCHKNGVRKQLCIKALRLAPWETSVTGQKANTCHLFLFSLHVCQQHS